MNQPYVQITNEGMLATFSNSLLLGHRFVFFNPAVTLAGDHPLSGILNALGATNIQPQIFPLLDGETDILGLAKVMGLPFPTAELGAIWVPQDLFAKNADVPIFFAFPNRRGETISVSLKKDGKTLRQLKIAIGVNGLAKHVLTRAGIGNYEVVMGEISCSFGVAEYRLLPLEAFLIDYKLRTDTNELEVKMRLIAYGKLLKNHDVQLELNEGTKRPLRVDSQNAQTDESGEIFVRFNLGEADESLTITVRSNTDSKKIAQVPVIGSKKTERELTQVNPLGQVVSVSLMPMSGSTEVRGLHHVYGAVNNTPFIIEGSIKDGASGQIIVQSKVKAPKVTIVVADSQGNTTVVHNGSMEAYQSLSIALDGPANTIFIGAWIDEGGSLKAWEGWSLVFTQSELELFVEVPTQVDPSGMVPITLRTNRLGVNVHVVLAVRDSRQTSQTSGKFGLAQAMKSMALATARSGRVSLITEQLYNPRIRHLRNFENLRYSDGDWRGGRGSEVLSAFRTSTFSDIEELNFMPALNLGEAIPKGALSLETQTQVVTQLVVARQEQLPVVYAEIVEVSGEATLQIPIGDALTRYEVTAFALDEMDWSEAKTQFEAVKAFSARITSPLFVHPRDVATTTIHIDAAPGRAMVTVKINGGRVSPKMNGAYINPGSIVDCPVDLVIETGPATIEVEVANAEIGHVGEVEDYAVAIIGELGKFTHTVQISEVLQLGQTLDATSFGATRMWVQPSLEGPMTTFQFALMSYQHKCCQQTAAAMLPALLMALGGNDDAREHFINGYNREKRMFVPGKGFMFYPPEEHGETWNRHYGEEAAKLLAQMAPYADQAGIDLELKTAIRDVADMGVKAARVYGLQIIPSVAANAQDAYRMATDASKLDLAYAYASNLLKPDPTGRYLIAASEQHSDIVFQREQTAYCAAICAKAGDLTKALMAANWVLSQFGPEQRPYSTTDSAATMLMFAELSNQGVVSANGLTSTRVRINGQEMTLVEAQNFSAEILNVEATSGLVVVGYEVEVQEDWESYSSTIPVSVGFAPKGGVPSNAIRLGEETNLVITLPNGYQPGLLAHIALPPALANVNAGADVKVFTVDFEGRNQISIPVIPLEATRGQHYGVLIRNMFKEEETGNPGLISVNVFN